MSIQDWGLKIKNWTEDVLGEWGIALIVLLVGISSFGLGRLSALENVQKPVSIIEAASTSTIPALPLGGEFVASRTGTVYYYPWCSGAAKILPQNQVWFASESAAQKAGYRAAKGCKGLGTE